MIGDECVHYQGHRVRCREGIDIRELVGAPTAGWVWRIPCLPGRKLSRTTEIVPCAKYQSQATLTMLSRRSDG